MEGMGQISPTKGNLLATQKSLTLAKMGYDLMDRKRNILVREMMSLIDQVDALRDQIDDTYGKAYKALEKANISLGRCEDIAASAPVENSLTLRSRSVMGVELPKVELKDPSFQLHYSLNATNSTLDEANFRFHKVKLMLVNLAQLENSVYRLAIAIKQTQSRANSLKNIIIPQYTQTVKNISNALDEAEREEFTRLKVIKRIKKEDHSSE